MKLELNVILTIATFVMLTLLLPIMIGETWRFLKYWLAYSLLTTVCTLGFINLFHMIVNQRELLQAMADILAVFAEMGFFGISVIIGSLITGGVLAWRRKR